MSDDEAVLEFWFGEDPEARQAKRPLWFRATPEFDRDCRQFEPLIERARAGGLAEWREQPRTALAFVVLCDQLPRNVYRGTARAFATDHLALAASTEGIRCGFDLALDPDERAFFYMPMEHSENVLDQHTAVGLFTALRDAAPAGERDAAGNSLRYAQTHRDVILRFGRFPHRNAVLNRTSTPEEIEYLETGARFGQ